MSGYLELARRSRARWEECRSRPATEVVTDPQAAQQSRPIHLDSEGRVLKAAGFELKERCGKIIWQRPDTGFWVSQETALHLLKNKIVKGDGKT